MSASSSSPTTCTLPFVNGATGPIEVHGAKAGDMLSVEVLDMKLEGLGFTSLWPGIGMFPDWVRHKEFGIQTRVVEVKDGIVHWNERLKLPVRPMIGVIGVAPVHGAVLTVDNGTHGGNLDVQEITTGNKVMFRVQHGRRAPLPRRLPRDPGRRRVRRHGRDRDRRGAAAPGRALEGAGAHDLAARSRRRPTIGTIGCARPLEDAMRIAFEEMIYWMEDDWGIPAPEAYMLLGQVAEARCTQMVNPKYTYICTIRKDILDCYR